MISKVKYLNNEKIKKCKLQFFQNQLVYVALEMKTLINPTQTLDILH